MFTDRLTLDASAPRRRDGYLLVHAKAARAGVYEYLGSEVDPEGKTFKANDTVKVYRSPEEVFDKASLASFVLRPITDDHPTVPVNASNWRAHAGGSIVGAVKDGDHVGFDLAFMDEGTVSKVDGGKVELSAGYSCDLVIGDGIAPDGTSFQAEQRNIRGNHVALVARGRAGPTCRVVADAASCDALPSLPKLNDGEPIVKTMLIDGLTVDIANADTAQATITTILAARDTATNKVAGLETQVATLTAEKTTLDAKVVTLEQAVKDAKPTPAQLRDAGKALVLAAGKAKALGITVSDEMDETAIIKAVVDAKVKQDLRQGWNDGQYAASFAVLSDGVQPVTTNDNGVQPLFGGTSFTTDAVALRDMARRNRNA